MIKLSELQAAIRSMGPSPWTFEPPSEPAGSVDIRGVRLLPDGRTAPTDEYGDPVVIAEWVQECNGVHNAAGIVALHTAAPVLLEIAQAALAYAIELNKPGSAMRNYPATVEAHRALLVAIERVSP